MTVEKVVRFVKLGGKIDYETDATKDGCDVYKNFADTGRYVVDFAPDFKSEGWLQYDTGSDAGYFGVWVNPEKKLELSYAEGDWYLTECHDVERYNRMIQRLNEFHDEGFIAIGISMDGEETRYVQDREQFLIK